MQLPPLERPPRHPPAVGRPTVPAWAAGPPLAPPVVLVAGLVISPRYLLPLARHLGRTHRVLVPELAGGTVGEQVEALVAFLDERGIRRAAFIGNSLGCQVLAELAASHPERVTRLVLIGPALDPRAGLLRQVVRLLWTALQEPIGLVLLFLVSLARHGPLAAVRSARDALDHPLRARLRRVRQPTLVIRGLRDAVSGARWVREAVRLLPRGALVELPAAAHAPHYEAPARVVEVALPFLRGAPPHEPHAEEPPPPPFVTAFDSSTGVLRATIKALRGQGMPAPDRPRRAPLQGLMPLGNALPAPVRRSLYRAAGAHSARSVRELARVDHEAWGRWVAACHPRRRLPLIAIGSPNGAVAHLCAAVGGGYVPQNLLITVRRRVADQDDLREELAWGAAHAGPLLRRNPHLQLHHMADPNQDRLMERAIAYFRCKLLRLGPALEAFLEHALEPGGTLLVVDCRKRWPVVRVGPRHVFQAGGVGGLEPEEYLRGGPRVEAFLRREGARHRRWDPSPPNAEAPEAEWGFEAALLDDLLRVAERIGARVRRLSFEEVDGASPLVAELYRAWLRSCDLPDDRLLVSSFMLLDPDHAIRSGAVPFWTSFPVQPSADALERYLNKTGPFEAMHALLFAHGIRSAGLADAPRWRSLLARGHSPGRLVGVDPRAFPADLGVYGRYARELRRVLPEIRPRPASVEVGELESFLQGQAAHHGAIWEALLR